MMIKKNEIIKNNKNFIGILKYLTYQNFEIRDNLLNTIHKLSVNKHTLIDNLNDNDKSNILRLIDILKDTFDNDDDYKYYVLIIESLPNTYLRNLFRLFNYKYIKLKNENEKFEDKEIKFFTWKYNLHDFNTTNNPKNKLINLLEYLKIKDPNIIKFFISCINHFFT